MNTVVKDYKGKTSLLIDIVVTTDNNISVKEYNNISKYKTWKWKLRKRSILKLSLGQY